MESKHRYRNAAAAVNNLGDAPPGMFWSMKRESGHEAARKWLSTAYDGKSVDVKKIDGEWRVVETLGAGTEKAENANPADTFNTCLKMAKKRAFVDATITATSSNDFFTQDLDDIAENMKAARESMDGEDGGEDERPKKEKEKPQNDWRDAVNHIGARKGPLTNKKLGDIDDGGRAFLLRTLTEKGERMNRQDKALFHALQQWQTEHSGGKKKESTAPSKEPEPGNEGVNLKVLLEMLDFNAIPLPLFLDVARREGWTKAGAIEEITHEEATAMGEQFDAVNAKCLDEYDARKASGGAA